MAKARLDYTGIDQLMVEIEKADGNLQDAAKEALTRSHRFVTKKVEKAMPAHKINGKLVNWEHTGQTKESLIQQATVEMSGGVASTEVGFGFPGAAYYLIRGTPRMQPDHHLEDAMNGKNTKRQVHEIHEEAFEDYLAELLGE